MLCRELYVHHQYRCRHELLPSKILLILKQNKSNPFLFVYAQLEKKLKI